MVGINFSQQPLNMSDFITIDCEVRTHNRVFGGNRTKAHRLVLNVTAIVALHPHDCGNSCGVIVAQQPCARSLNGRFSRVLTTHREIADQSTRINRSVTGLLNPLIGNLAIAVADFCGNLGVPHRARQQSLNGIYQPYKVRMGIGNLDLGNAHFGAHTLGNRTNLQRQIAELPQVSDLLVFISAFTQSIGQHTIVFIQNFFQVTIEEVVIKAIDQIFVNKGLKAEESNMVDVSQSAHTRSVIRRHLNQILGILLMMGSLVEVNHQKRIVIIHSYQIPFSNPQIVVSMSLGNTSA